MKSNKNLHVFAYLFILVCIPFLIASNPVHANGTPPVANLISDDLSMPEPPGNPDGDPNPLPDGITLHYTIPGSNPYAPWKWGTLNHADLTTPTEVDFTWQDTAMQEFSLPETTESHDVFTNITPTYMIQPVWKGLLLVYTNTDVSYIDSNGASQHLTTSMPEDQLLNALMSFRQSTSITHDFSNQEAIMTYDIVYVNRPINSLTSLGSYGYWVSPSDIHTELDQYAPPGKYDSIYVHWMLCDMDTNQCIPSYGWGWGMIASGWSNGATYATVTNGDEWLWNYPTIGEVWMHEWLHGALPFYENRGYIMPKDGVHAGGTLGYTHSPTTGWADFYRDLMTGHVLENGVYKGITPAAWRSGTILNQNRKVYVDYFYSDTLSTYNKVGDATWQSVQGNITLGGTPDTDNQIYTNTTPPSSFIIQGRVYIPDTGVGWYDSVAVALSNDQDTYYATLAYGTNLVEKDNLSIIHNDQWGTLSPKTLSPGWYSIKVFVDYKNYKINMKAWKDGESEPGWQTSRIFTRGWSATKIGFRHYGSGTIADDLMVYSSSTTEKTCYPLTLTHSGSGRDPIASPLNSYGCAGGHYHKDEKITLTAKPDVGWQVLGWSGADQNTTTRTNQLTMPASSRTVLVTYEAMEFYGSAEISAGQPIIAISRPHIEPEIMAYNGSGTAATNVYLPMLFNDKWGYTSTFTVQNITGSQATFSITFKDAENGTTDCILSAQTLPAHRAKTYDVTKLGTCDGGGSLPADWFGGAAISSNQAVVAVAKPDINGSDAVAYNGFTGGAATAYLPMLFRGKWGYQSAFYVQNLDSGTNATVTIAFYDSDGNYTCTFNDPNPIGPYVTRGYWMAYIDNTTQCLGGTGFPSAGWAGSAVVTSAGSSNIVTIGRPHLGDEVAAYNGFTSGSTKTYLPMLFRNIWGYNAAFYIQNISNENSTIEITFYDVKGNQVCKYTDPLALESNATRGYWTPALNCNDGNNFPLSGWAGSAKIETSKEVIAVGRPHLTNGQVVAYNGAPGGTTDTYLPLLYRSFGGYGTALYIQNLGDIPTTATITFYDERNGFYCQMQQQIDPGSAGAIWFPSLDVTICIP